MMPDNIVKALTHISEVVQQIDSQCQGCTSAQAMLELIKELQGNISKEIEQKLSVLESKLNASSPPSKHLETATKEIGQAVQNLKAVASKMGKSIAQVTDTNSQLENTAMNFKDALLKSNIQWSQIRPQPSQEKQSHADLKVLHVPFFLPNCAYHTDYHWDCLLYFVIIPFMHRLYTYSLTCLTPYMTHTTTDTSSIQTMTQSYSY
jgi:hypothetical protein